jgi:hypothetical protein
LSLAITKRERFGRTTFLGLVIAGVWVSVSHNTCIFTL